MIAENQIPYFEQPQTPEIQLTPTEILALTSIQVTRIRKLEQMEGVEAA